MTIWRSVSIPQAVSTVATTIDSIKGNKDGSEYRRLFTGKIVVDKILFTTIKSGGNDSFNTASGKHCCNGQGCNAVAQEVELVSIPQAVSTVATLEKTP